MTSEELEAKLEQARNGAKRYGQLRAMKEMASERLKGVYAQVYEDAPEGSIPEKDAWVRRDKRYIEAVQEAQNAHADWTTAELWTKILFAEVELFRTVEASNRGLDRAHR